MCVVLTVADCFFHTIFLFSRRVFFQTGFLDSEPLKEADEDFVSEVDLNHSVMTEEEKEEIQQELAKVHKTHTSHQNANI